MNGYQSDSFVVADGDGVSGSSYHPSEGEEEEKEDIEDTGKRLVNRDFEISVRHTPHTSGFPFFFLKTCTHFSATHPVAK